MKLPNLHTEPVLLLVGAAILVALGVDLASLAENVERIVQAVVVIAGAAAARQRVYTEPTVEQVAQAAAELARTAAADHERDPSELPDQ